MGKGVVQTPCAWHTVYCMSGSLVELMLACRKEGRRGFRLATGKDMDTGPKGVRGVGVGEARASGRPPWKR